jgi:predicted HTH domain antitoxin
MINSYVLSGDAQSLQQAQLLQIKIVEMKQELRDRGG